MIVNFIVTNIRCEKFRETVLDLFSLFCVRKKNLPSTVLYNEPRRLPRQSTFQKSFRILWCPWIISWSSTSVMAIAGIQILFKYCNLFSINDRRGEITTRAARLTTNNVRDNEQTLTNKQLSKARRQIYKHISPLKNALIASCCSGSRSVNSNCTLTAS